MFDDNHIEESDLLMRSILADAQEEVPAHVWEGVEGGLAKAARRRTAVLWIGRAVTVAAAAAVAVGVFFRHGQQDMPIPDAEGDMIAVAEKEIETAADEILLANVESKVISVEDIITESVSSDDVETAGPASYEQHPETSETVLAYTASEEENGGAPVKSESGSSVADAPAKIEDDFDWEDEKAREKIRTSLVVSGIAGTNSPQNAGKIGPFKSPGMYMAPTKTTVEPTSAQTTYGIPLSVGAGVKMNFTKRWSLGMGLNYTLLTSRFNGKYTKVENGEASLPIAATVRNTQHFIGIPINAYYNLVSRDFISFYAYAGGAVEKCIADRYEVQTTPVIHHEEAVKGVQLSANAGIGVEFMLGRYVGLYIDPSLRYYFHCNQPKSIRTAQPLMIGFEMGFRFNL